MLVVEQNLVWVTVVELELRANVFKSEWTSLVEGEDSIITSGVNHDVLDLDLIS